MLDDIRKVNGVTKQQATAQAIIEVIFSLY